MGILQIQIRTQIQLTAETFTGVPRSESAESQSRRLSISLSQSIDNCKDFCRATYDYDATGRS